MICLLSNKVKEPYKDQLCLFRALVMYMNGHIDLDSRNSRYFTEFVSKSGYDPQKFGRVSVKDSLVVEEAVRYTRRRLCRRTSWTKYCKI